MNTLSAMLLYSLLGLALWYGMAVVLLSLGA
jgi:hypothetical protein